MTEKVFRKSREFIYRNARPLDLALWRYEFENGSRNDVVEILSFYQNQDGGFGHAIEPDFWNINSSPIATWKAIQILNEICIDRNEIVIEKIIEYLDSGKDFENGKWYNTIESNNDYPHAVWWGCKNGRGETSDNPTVSLAGFALKYAEKGSALYKKAVDIIKLSAREFIDSPCGEMHTLAVMLEMYEYCKTIDGFDLFDLSKFGSILYDMIEKAVCTDTEKWYKEYVCMPSFFFNKNKAVFDIVDPDFCKKEGDMIIKRQLDDGSYPVTWLWYNDFKEYYVAENWWKAHIVRMNMLYLKALNEL